MHESHIMIWVTFIMPRSDCADVATAHPDAGQPVYDDAPKHFSKNKLHLTLLTLSRNSSGPLESKTPVDLGSPRST